MINEKDLQCMEEAIEMSRLARRTGNAPYGAVLADKQGNVLMTQSDVSQAFVGHEDELTVEGPIPELEKEILSVHEGAWSTQGAASGAMAQRVYHWHKH